MIVWLIKQLMVESHKTPTKGFMETKKRSGPTSVDFMSRRNNMLK